MISRCVTSSIGLLALALLAAGCSEGGERGVFRYANGKLWSRVSFESGRPHGVWRSWWPDGTTKHVETWNAGELDGPFESWHANGRRMASGTYRAGQRDGEWRSWYSNGDLRRVENWHDGVLHGPSRSWFEDGKPRRVAEFDNGEHVGLRELWYENGFRKSSTTIGGADNPGVVGRLWYEDGSPMFDGRFLGGKLDGPARYWKENGELDRARSGVYAAGEKVADLPPPEDR